MGEETGNGWRGLNYIPGLERQARRQLLTAGNTRSATHVMGRDGRQETDLSRRDQSRQDHGFQKRFELGPSSLIAELVQQTSCTRWTKACLISCSSQAIDQTYANCDIERSLSRRGPGDSRTPPAAQEHLRPEDSE